MHKLLIKLAQQTQKNLKKVRISYTSLTGRRSKVDRSYSFLCTCKLTRLWGGSWFLFTTLKMFQLRLLIVDQYVPIGFRVGVGLVCAAVVGFTVATR